MKKTRLGVNDGEIYPREYQKGKEFNVGKDLARVFISNGDAEEVKGAKAKKPHDNKAKAPHENK